jgi:hypothetical protein
MSNPFNYPDNFDAGQYIGDTLVEDFAGLGILDEETPLTQTDEFSERYDDADWGGRVALTLEVLDFVEKNLNEKENLSEAERDRYAFALQILRELYLSLQGNKEPGKIGRVRSLLSLFDYLKRNDVILAAHKQELLELFDFDAPGSIERASLTGLGAILEKGQKLINRFPCFENTRFDFNGQIRTAVLKELKGKPTQVICSIGSGSGHVEAEILNSIELENENSGPSEQIAPTVMVLVDPSEMAAHLSLQNMLKVKSVGRFVTLTPKEHTPERIEELKRWAEVNNKHVVVMIRAGVEELNPQAVFNIAFDVRMDHHLSKDIRRQFHEQFIGNMQARVFLQNDHLLQKGGVDEKLAFIIAVVTKNPFLLIDFVVSELKQYTGEELRDKIEELRALFTSHEIKNLFPKNSREYTIIATLLEDLNNEMEV